MTGTPSTPKDPKPAEGTGVCLTPQEPTKAPQGPAKTEPKAGSVDDSKADSPVGSTGGSTSADTSDAS
jgi:hypothetical protein